MRTGYADTLQPILAAPDKAWWDSVNYLGETFKSNKPAFDLANGIGFFAHLGANPELAQNFNIGLAGYTRHDDAEVVALLEKTNAISSRQSIVDIAGGNGGLLRAINARYPENPLTLYEQTSAEEGPYQIEHGSFFTAAGSDGLPSGKDVYIVKGTLHDFSDEQCKKILLHIREVIPRDSTFYLIERTLPSANISDINWYGDLLMMMLLTGRGRTANEWKVLLEASGFAWLNKDRGDFAGDHRLMQCKPQELALQPYGSYYPAPKFEEFLNKLRQQADGYISVNPKISVNIYNLATELEQTPASVYSIDLMNLLLESLTQANSEINHLSVQDDEKIDVKKEKLAETRFLLLSRFDKSNKHWLSILVDNQSETLYLLDTLTNDYAKSILDSDIFAGYTQVSLSQSYQQHVNNGIALVSWIGVLVRKIELEDYADADNQQLWLDYSWNLIANNSPQLCEERQNQRLVSFLQDIMFYQKGLPLVEKMRQSIKDGQPRVLRQLLQQDINLEEKDADGNTALHWAVMAGHKDCLEALLKSGANIESKNESGETALHWAAEKGHKDCLDALLGAGANIEAGDDYGATALCWAAMAGHKDCLEALLGAGENIEVENNDRMIALRSAAFNGHKNCLEVLLGAGANIEAEDNDGDTALHWAAEKGHKDCLEVLLEAGTNIEAEDNDGRTALHQAAANDHKDCLDILLEIGASIEAEDNYGWTALHLAARAGHKDCLDALLGAGANIEAEGNDGNTALHRAAMAGHKDCLEVLLGVGDNIEAQTNKGSTALHLAAMAGHKDCLEVLLGVGANIEAENNDGYTALHLAARDGHKDCLDALFGAGANVEAQTNKGRSTALHWAAVKGHKDCLEALLKAGAKIEAENNNGFTALQIATWTGHKDCLEALLNAKIKIEAADVNGEDNADEKPDDILPRRGSFFQPSIEDVDEKSDVSNDITENEGADSLQM